MTELRPILVELVSQLGSSREAREYLRRFASLDSMQFAIIGVDRETANVDRSELVGALGFLRHVGLFPIVVQAAGSDRASTYEHNRELTGALELAGVRAQPLVGGVLTAADAEGSGVTSVNTGAVRQVIAGGALPIVACVGETEAAQVALLDEVEVVSAMARELEPQKVIFLNRAGGMRNQRGTIIPAINLVTDYDPLFARANDESRSLLATTRQLLDRLPPSSSVSITSAKHLPRELFTHRGRGTLIRRGERFETASALDRDDEQTLQSLLEECFGRSLRSDYFARLDLEQMIWAQSRRAAAVITTGVANATYLDKFAVTTEAQGEGLGAALWQLIADHHPRLYWRSRSDNPVNGWYQKQSDISVAAGSWRIFARGISLDEVSPCIEDAEARPQSWEAIQ